MVDMANAREGEEVTALLFLPRDEYSRIGRWRKLRLLILLVDGDDDTNHNGDDDDDNDDDEEAPPLLAAGAAGLFDSAADFGVGLHHIFVDLLALLLDVGDKGLLLHDDLVEVLEQLGELHHLLLDLQNRLVALLDVAESRGRLATAVGAEELWQVLARIRSESRG